MRVVLTALLLPAAMPPGRDRRRALQHPRGIGVSIPSMRVQRKLVRDSVNEFHAIRKPGLSLLQRAINPFPGGAKVDR